MPKLLAKNPDDTEFVTIPEGTLLSAQLEEVELRTFEWEGKDIEKLRWNFLIIDEDYTNKKINGETSNTFTNHPNCKAMKWAMALSGRTFEEGEELDTDDLMGLKGIIAVVNKKGKDDRIWHNVGDVFAAKGMKTAEDLF